MSDRPYPKCCEELDAYQSSAAEIQDELERLRATLAAVREWAKGGWAENRIAPLQVPTGSINDHLERGRWVGVGDAALEVLAILDEEVEQCPTCGGTDREGGTVAIKGPDEFGNYDTDDCPDEFHR